MWLLSGVTVVALLKVLAFLNVADVGGVSALSWWWVVGGYVLCAGWFAYADHSGLTTRKAMERMEERKKARIEKQRELLGMRRPKR